MDTRYLAHLAAGSDFYELAWADAGPADLAVDGLPAGWRRDDRGPWLVYRDDAAPPDAGWKVHVAVRPERARAVVPAVVTVCLQNEVAVKTLRSTRLVRLTQAKYSPPAASGKVITAYPADEDALERLVDRLTDLLRGEPGVRIPGEIPVSGTPITLRFGAFRGLWLAGADGRAVPGMRTGGRTTPDRRAGARPDSDPRTMPRYIAALSAAAHQQDSGEKLDIRDAVLLHRSNAGGVYRAVWPDGRTVVAKEARRHTGFDGGGADAVTRLRHEWAVLQRLSGSGVAPEPVSYVTVGSSDFLIMDYVPGSSAAAAMAGTHPGVVPGAPPGSGDAYRRWAEQFVERTRKSLCAMHSRGIVHRDLHPGNLIDAGDRVVLIDLESAALDGLTITTDVRNSALGAATGSGPEADLRALDRLRTVLVNPLAVLLDARPDLANELIRVGETDLDHDGAFPAQPAPEQIADRVAAGIALSATPDRPDRLFPCDIDQFVTPHADLGLLHGAGGVLLALHAASRDIAGNWTERLLTDTARATAWTRGLADGVDGVALCLALLGQYAAAAALVDRLVDDKTVTTAAPWWAAGRTGMAVTAAELAGELNDTRLEDRARRHVASVIDAVDRAEPAAGHRPGLLTGWAGVALGLLRVAELSDDPTLRADCRAAADRALRRELASAVRVGSGMLMRDRRKVMPYLGIGSAATALAADALEAVGRKQDPEIIPAVAATLRRPVVIGAGLLLGRAGILLTLERLTPTDPAVAGHRDRLSWHCMPPRSQQLRREDPAALLVLGEQNLRCAADLGTGAAGVLLALDTQHRDPLADVLRLPRGQR